MNRQQRRQAERQAKKDASTFRSVLANPAERNRNAGVIRAAFKEGQVLNNHEWAVRLERIRNVLGIGPKRLHRIFEALEEPLTAGEREKARKSFESGDDHVDFIGN